MKAICLLRVLTLGYLTIGMLLLGSCERKSEKSARKELKLPDQSDPRFATLATKVPKQAIAMVSLSDFIARVELAKLLKSPVMLRGELDQKLININFEGGTLKDLLEDISSDAHVTVTFEKFCVSIQPE